MSISTILPPLRSGLALDATPRAARELTRRHGRAVHDRRDLVERHAEHVVQHEWESLRRLDGLQDHEEREPDRVREHGVGLRILVGASDHGIGYVRGMLIEGILSASATGPRHTRATTVVSRARRFSTPGAAESNPAFLNGIVCFARRPEHSIGHRAQMRPVLFELLGEPLRCGHRSHSSVAVRHGSDGRNIDDVTEQEEKMKFVLLVFHGPTPTLPGSDRWNALPEAEKQKAYADYAELNKTEGITPGPPLGLPEGARTVQVRDGKVQVKNGTYLGESAGGYSVYEAESMDAAIALAARVPAARLGGAVEIRPAEKYW